jgi:hypothetical protein
MVGTAVEHHTLYQYQFADTSTVFAGQVHFNHTTGVQQTIG